MALVFQVSGSGDGSFDWPGTSAEELSDSLNALLDEKQSGTVTGKKYFAQLHLLIQNDPDFIDAHVHLAMAHLDDGKPKKALESALSGLTVAQRLIPEGFNGTIFWADLSNRPYLRILHTAVIAYIRLGKHKEAVQFIERMLMLNPNDNQGVRYLLGSEALSAKDTEKAKHAFERYADEYPAYWYELAWLLVTQGNWIPAATALRRGFAANPYVAEMIVGYSRPIPLVIWHGSNVADETGADDYFSSYDARWVQRTDIIYFVRWLFNHSSILVERAEFLRLKEQLKWERDFAARSALVDQETRLTATIDDELSRQIVKQHTNRYGQTIYPWMEMLHNV